MNKLSNLEPYNVFKYFEEISAIPRGSGNMEKISDYCMDFAKKHSLKAIKDEANNVIIYKAATAGYENSETVILQGHLDMVCQKENGCKIDFEKDGLDLYVDGYHLKARGTTLGADNGIAVAMVLSILASDDIAHPPIEALFTTDEEIGMIGAGRLDADCLKGKKMINLDAEEPQTLTVSCAGGSDFKITIPIIKKQADGTLVTLAIKDLKGGHSGIEIDKGRVNASILAGRLLSFAKSVTEFDLISIDGGDKANAIPNSCTVKLLTKDPDKLVCEAEKYINIIKEEISAREPDASITISTDKSKAYEVIDPAITSKLIYTLMCAPNGVLEMSADIDGLVETSLNLGILKTDENEIIMQYALRSNKQSALNYLEERLKVFASVLDVNIETGGHYPPWEFKHNSVMQTLYKETYKEKFGTEPEVVAIHAGLECGILSAKIKDLDCIAIGPCLMDVHTVNEKLSITSAKEIYELVVKLLEKCK